jgi:hypothetical protein
LKGVSRNALRALEADEVETADLRPAQIARLQHVSGEVLDTIQEVFAGTSLPEDQGRVGEVLQARRAVNEAWDKARANFVEIGRALNALDARLVSKEERAALRRGFDRLFPLSESIAYQFRAVAKLIDSGRLPLDECPGSYSAAYQIALLKPEEFDEARRRGLIGQGTTRAAIIAFRKGRCLAPTMTVNIEALLAEQRRLQETERRLLDELDRVRGRAVEIARLLDEGEKA